MCSSDLLWNGQDDADVIRLRASGTGSATLVNGGNGNDAIEIGNVANSLDNLGGVICLDGDANLVAPTSTLSVSCDGTTISNTLAVGDVLTIHDEGDATANAYTVTDTSVSRGGLKINYGTIETLNLNAGTGADTITVTTTAASKNTNIATTAGGDTVTVTATGASSNVTITGDKNANAITLTTTGANSVTVVSAGAGADTLTQNGSGANSGVQWNGEADADAIRIRASGAGSVTVASGGDGNDTFDLGNASNSLDDLAGKICVDGDANLANPTNTLSVTSDGTTVSNTLAVGDVLTIHDEGDSDANAYTLTNTLLTRGGVTIDYGTIETLNLNAGTGTDTINVTTTAGSVNTNIATTAGGDTVNVTNTGTLSNVTITGDVGVNAISVATTGANSVMVVAAGAGDDLLTQNANGNASGMAWYGEAGDDTVAVKTSALSSATLVDGGADNDLVELGNGTLTAIQGATSLIGGSNRAAVTVDVFQVTNVGTSLSTTPTSIETGDRLRLLDASGTGGVSYVVSPARITRATLAPSVLYSTFEQMDLNAGSGSDYVSLLKRVDVNTDTAAVVDSLPSIMRIDGGTGLSNFVSYRNEAGSDNVVLGSTGVTTVNSSTAEATLQLANVQRAEAIGNGTENKIGRAHV